MRSYFFCLFSTDILNILFVPICIADHKTLKIIRILLPLSMSPSFTYAPSKFLSTRFEREIKKMKESNRKFENALEITQSKRGTIGLTGPRSNSTNGYHNQITGRVPASISLRSPPQRLPVWFHLERVVSASFWRLIVRLFFSLSFRDEGSNFYIYTFDFCWIVPNF